MKTLRIGNGQEFWGDNVDAPVELLRGGPLDYLGMDYLAEMTLSIMMRRKLKNPKLGYATDFIGFIRRVLTRPGSKPPAHHLLAIYLFSRANTRLSCTGFLLGLHFRGLVAATR
jgi:hypothetical protein